MVPECPNAVAPGQVWAGHLATCSMPCPGMEAAAARRLQRQGGCSWAQGAARAEMHQVQQPKRHGGCRGGRRGVWDASKRERRHGQGPKPQPPAPRTAAAAAAAAVQARGGASGRGAGRPFGSRCWYWLGGQQAGPGVCAKRARPWLVPSAGRPYPCHSTTHTCTHTHACTYARLHARSHAAAHDRRRPHLQPLQRL